MTARRRQSPSFDLICTVLYSYEMGTDRIKGVEDARNELPELLNEAERGRSTLITRRGRPVAELVPIGRGPRSGRQLSLLGLSGSGRGLWSTRSGDSIGTLRDEWTR